MSNSYCHPAGAKLSASGLLLGRTRAYVHLRIGKGYFVTIAAAAESSRSQTISEINTSNPNFRFPNGIDVGVFIDCEGEGKNNAADFLRRPTISVCRAGLD